MTTSTTYNPSLYSSLSLDATGNSGGGLYTRNATNVLNPTIDTATKLGTLSYNKTQLGVTAQASRANPTQFYKVSLDGTSMKLDLTNITGTTGLRLQLLDSSGKIVADSSEFGTEDNQTAYDSLSSSDGLTLKSGDYYVKVTFDATSLRSVPQTYSVEIYSGESFLKSYQTTAAAQVKATQVVPTDDTMTFSLITALQYSNKDTHLANETSDDAINIGWLSEDKSALGVKSLLSATCDEEYYSFTLQKGDNLKMAFTNRTDTSDLRVQVLDVTGLHVYADNYGTTAQKAAFEALQSSDGLTAKTGKYIVKVSYAQGEAKKNQTYELKLFSGETYDKYYTTTVGAETASTAIMSGHMDGNNPRAAAASYLASQMSQDFDAVFYYLYQKTI